MRNIPVFTTDFGVASLILKEIPYKQLAFVIVRDVQPGGLRELLTECVGFCRAAGAERVLASGCPELEAYPVAIEIEKMTLTYTPEMPPAMLWPVTEETVCRWRTLYNEKMSGFDAHATLSAAEEKEILTSGGAYFVHRDGETLGLGWVEGEELLALVSVKPGMGETVARTLFTAMNTDRITLEVAADNAKALALYRKMGFVTVGERRIYKIL